MSSGWGLSDWIMKNEDHDQQVKSSCATCQHIWLKNPHKFSFPLAFASPVSLSFCICVQLREAEGKILSWSCSWRPDSHVCYCVRSSFKLSKCAFDVRIQVPFLPWNSACMQGCMFRRGRPLRGGCLKSSTLSNKHSSLIIKKDASWGCLLRLHRGREGVVQPWLLSLQRRMF